MNRKEEEADLLRECQLLYQLRSSSYILDIEEIFLYKDRRYVFLEYMEGRSISEIVESRYLHYDEDFIKYTIWCVAKGLKEMHDEDVLHRDLKADNILCRPDGQVKVADLGSSMPLTNKEHYRTTRDKTTLYLRPPEMIQRKPYDKKCDIW